MTVSPPIFQCHQPMRQTVPIVVTSPHSGQYYPPELLRQSALTVEDLRKLEDCFVNELWNFVPSRGAPLLAMNVARAYVDVNREAMELDPMMYHAPLPIQVSMDSARVRSGLGSIPKLAATGQEIYQQKIHFIDVLQRIDNVYRPFHRQLARMIRQTRAQYGFCLLLDCHSMPNIAVSSHESIPGVDIVLGDRFGRSAKYQTLELLENAFLSAGFTVRRNDPYAGGFIAQNYGTPDSGVECVQIEINRRLYMNESRMEKNADFDYVADRLCKVWQKIADNIPNANVQENLLAAE